MGQGVGYSVAGTVPRFLVCAVSQLMRAQCSGYPWFPHEASEGLQAQVATKITQLIMNGIWD